MALEVRFHDRRNESDVPLPDQAVTIDDGDVLVVGRRPSMARDSHAALVAGRRLIGIGVEPNDPAETRLSRVQLAIYSDDDGLPRVLNLGRFKNIVELQRFGRRARGLPIAPPHFQGRSSGELLPSACTVWLPLTAPGAAPRRISILNSLAHDSNADGNGDEYSRTNGGPVFPWPPQAQAHALVALAAPLLRFPALTPVPAVQHLHNTSLRSAADELVRNLGQFNVRLNARKPDTLEYLMDSGSITLRRLHHAYAGAPVGSPLRKYLGDTEALYGWLEQHRRAP